MNKRENQITLIEYLKKHNDWVNSDTLSCYLHASTRSIRTYIKEINQTYSKNNLDYILSSKQGYKINPNSSNNKSIVPNQRARSHEILLKLMQSSYDINFYDLSESMFISESTLTKELKRIKILIQKFDLTLENNSWQLSIKGKETSKRKLLNFLLSEENYKYFENWLDLSEILPDNDINKFQSSIENLLNNHCLYLNDYALINIMIHLVIAIVRIKENMTIENDFSRHFTKVELKKMASDGAIQSAYDIASFIADKYYVIIPEADIVSIALIITSNTCEIDTNTANINNLSLLIDPEYLEAINHSLDKVTSCFYLSEFDDEFKLKFTLHVYNMFKRSQNNCSIKNPFSDNLKSTYPIIYDIALMFCNDLSQKFNIIISKDEIAFIVFHFGSYFEKEKQNKKLSCAFYYDEYYDFETIILDKLQKYFSSQIEFVDVRPYKKFDRNYSIDLIITTVSNFDKVSHENVVTVNPIITNKDIQTIKKAINQINFNKKKNEISYHLNRFTKNKLFKEELYLNNENEYIKYLCEEVKELGFITDDFTKDVLLRESLSSTSFDNIVAIPHTLNVNTKTSFFSIVINERPIDWGIQTIHIIILIGINSNDIASFREIFDCLVEILTKPINYKRIISCKKQEDFIKEFISITSDSFIKV